MECNGPSEAYIAKKVLLPAALWAGLLFFIGSFFYEKDLTKVEKVALSVEEA